MNAPKVSLLLLPLALACEDATSSLPDAGSVPAADAQAPPDAGFASDAELAVPDAGPARTFVERSMFGDAPVTNLVFDPLFDLSSYNWYGLESSGFSLVPVEKHFRARTPLHQPAVRVPKARFTRGVYLMGSAAAASGAVEASVWTGRAPDAADPVLAAVVAVGPSGPEVSYDLVPDEGTRVELDGVSWIRSSVILPDTIGVLSFLIGDDGNVPYWVSSPVVIPVNMARPRGEVLSAHPAGARERALLARFAALKAERNDPRRR